MNIASGLLSLSAEKERAAALTELRYGRERAEYYRGFAFALRLTAEIYLNADPVEVQAAENESNFLRYDYCPRWERALGKRV